jgi:two-component system cell cycle sensor histidine kinase/response regulator CckA
MNEEEGEREEAIHELKWLRYSLEKAREEALEQERLKEELRSSEAMVKLILDLVPEALVVVDGEGRVILGNRVSAERFDVSLPELKGAIIYDLLPSEVSRRWRKEIGEVFFSGNPLQVEDDRGVKHYVNTIQPVFDEVGAVSGVAILSTDVTGQRNAEAVREDLEKRYRITYDTAVEGMFQASPDGAFLRVNNSLAQILGYSSAEDFLTSNTEIASRFFFDGEDRARFLRTLKERNVVSNLETQLCRKDGAKVWVSMNARTVRNRKRRVVYFEGTVEDVSRRKRLEVQLVQSQKTEVIGRLAGGMAHDFGNLLTKILGNLEVLLQDVHPGDPGHEEILAVQETADQATKVCRQLIALSRSQLVRAVEVDINDVVLRMEELLKRLLGEDIEYELILEPHLRTVKADPALVEQILLNLSVNAREAMPKGGKLTIATSTQHFDIEYCRIHREVMPGEYTMLAVSDSGGGIPHAVLDHIFEPFHMVRPDGRGLGLSIVHSIVKHFGGHISAESEAGRGTTFRISFPGFSGEEETGADTPHRETRFLQPGKGTVLVVEDDPGIRHLVMDILESFGYTVLTASTVEEGITVVEKSIDPVDLLISDVVLPGKQGTELVKLLKARYPEMPAMLISGYSDDRIPHSEILKGNVHFLAKPFTPLTLAMKVQEILGGTRTIL